MSNTTDENDLRREYYNDRQFLKKNELYVSKSYFRYDEHLLSFQL